MGRARIGPASGTLQTLQGLLRARRPCVSPASLLRSPRGGVAVRLCALFLGLGQHVGKTLPDH